MKTFALLILLIGLCAFVSADDEGSNKKGEKLQKLIGFLKEKLPFPKPSGGPSGRPRGPPRNVCCKLVHPRRRPCGEGEEKSDDDELYEDRKGKGPKRRGPIYVCRPCPPGPRPSGRPSGTARPSGNGKPTWRPSKSDEDEPLEEEDAGFKKLIGLLSKRPTFGPSNRPSGRPCGPPENVCCRLAPRGRKDDEDENDEIYEDQGKGPKGKGARYLCRPCRPRPRPSGRPSRRPRPTRKSDEDELLEDEDAGLIGVPSNKPTRPSNRPSGCPRRGLQMLCCRRAPGFLHRLRGNGDDDDDDNDEAYEDMDKKMRPKGRRPIFLCRRCPPRPSGRPSERPRPSGRPRTTSGGD